MRRGLVIVLLLCACGRVSEKPAPVSARPSILLVTLDTTRADAFGPHTPAFNALAARGLQFRYAYATVPQTLPSHASMFTGLYPAGHGVRENARLLDGRHSLLAERLRGAGYATAAFISAYPVAKRFGIGRGFDVYDEDFGDAAERDAGATTSRVLGFLQRTPVQPLFLWVHYFDPHYPYTPPEPFRSRHAKNPYIGEVAFMDEQMGRLIAAFEKSTAGPHAVVVVADHGEGLGEHGEQQHGNLLYQTTMHVPMVAVGPGIAPGAHDTPFSTRRIYDLVLRWAGIGAAYDKPETVVLGEAMQPFLHYGWQPQIMAVEGRLKTVLAGRLEVYDVADDPRETRNLAAKASLSREVRATLRDYPLPSSRPSQPPASLGDEERRKLASLGYVASTARPVVRKNAPVPAEMTDIFPLLDRAAGLFVREQYREAIPLFREIQDRDPQNVDAALRVAIAYSAIGNDDAALAAFRRAEEIAPESADVRAYLALHLAKGKDWRRAVPMLERIVAEDPRLPALEALAVVRERQGRIEETVALRQRIYTQREATAAERSRLGELQMALGQTTAAIASFEQARALRPALFRHDLELGVLYLAAGRMAEARAALDRVPPSHPAWPMALFKRAQVSVLLREPDAATRIARARESADATTLKLIARERLFASK